MILRCPVRDCHLPLSRAASGPLRLFCPTGHSFDAARSGYFNLLQPQERRSKSPGDTALAVAARKRLHDRGVTQLLLEAIADITKCSKSDVVLDAGCGDGFYLGSLARQTGMEAHGIDISIPAVDSAAKRFPEYEWIVANADRRIPYSDQSFSLVLSLTARMNPDEFYRVLKPADQGGRLLVALPAPDDLIELRGKGRDDRVDRTTQAFSHHFELIDQRRAMAKADLDEAALDDIRKAIYRPMGSPATYALDATGNLSITFALDLLLFRPRATGQQNS